MMKHLTKIFVSLAIILFVIGYYLQATGHENQGVKLLLAAIMFIICALLIVIMIERKTENNILDSILAFDVRYRVLF